MKKLKKIIMVLIMALIFTGAYLPQASMSYASESSNVTKMLNSFKKHHYITANKYAKKLKSTKDASEKRMTYSMKKAYKNILKKYPSDDSSLTGKKYLWDAYLVDMDGDNKPELLAKYGSCEANVVTRIYKYKSGKAIRIGQFKSIHTSFSNYPGHRGVICEMMHESYQNISTVCLRNGKICRTNYGTLNFKYKEHLCLNLKQLNSFHF